MRLRIISIWAVLILAGLLPQLAKAQIAASNPLEWAALAEGNELINGQIDKQIKGQTQTALMQNSIAAEFNRIHEWEKQYNSYLKTASGYASSLKACTHLYNDGVRIFLTLEKLGKAIRNNPQGIVASMNMNNLYIETATELVSVFTLLNDAVAKGGTENMLTGAGMPRSCMGTEARSAMSRESTSSEGSSSPTWRLPISRTPAMMRMYRITVRISAVNMASSCPPPARRALRSIPLILALLRPYYSLILRCVFSKSRRCFFSKKGETTSCIAGRFPIKY